MWNSWKGNGQHPISKGTVVMAPQWRVSSQVMGMEIATVSLA